MRTNGWGRAQQYFRPGPEDIAARLDVTVTGGSKVGGSVRPKRLVLGKGGELTHSLAVGPDRDRQAFVISLAASPGMGLRER